MVPKSSENRPRLPRIQTAFLAKTDKPTVISVKPRGRNTQVKKEEIDEASMRAMKSPFKFESLDPEQTPLSPSPSGYSLEKLPALMSHLLDQNNTVSSGSSGHMSLAGKIQSLPFLGLRVPPR